VIITYDVAKPGVVLVFETREELEIHVTRLAAMLERIKRGESSPSCPYVYLAHLDELPEEDVRSLIIMGKRAASEPTEEEAEALEVIGPHGEDDLCEPTPPTAPV